MTFRTTVTRKFCNLRVHCSGTLDQHGARLGEKVETYVQDLAQPYHVHQKRSQIQSVSYSLPILLRRKTPKSKCQHNCKVRNSTHDPKWLDVLVLPQPNSTGTSQPSSFQSRA